MSSHRRKIKLEAPFLKRVWLDDRFSVDYNKYPFNIPVMRDLRRGISFVSPVTVFVGENGSGKSTVLEGIAECAGYDLAGGGKGYRPIDHGGAVEIETNRLSMALKESWLPKITEGWFFRSESFFSVARYLDQSAIEVGETPPAFLSHSHGESFLRFIKERCQRPGIFMFDEPESALSPQRQIDFIKILHEIVRPSQTQIIMVTHSPLLMAFPGAEVLHFSEQGIVKVDFKTISHFQIMKEFYEDPDGFVDKKLCNMY